MVAPPHCSPYLAVPLLPHDLTRAIVAICPTETLTTIALVNKGFRAEAERRIYESIILATFDENLGALEALIAAPARAAYVKLLSVEFDSESEGFDETAMDMILSSASSFSSLKELRIRSQRSFSNTPDFMDGVKGLLCGLAPFQLTNLFVEDCVDLPSIIQHQQKLELLGLFRCNDLKGPMSLLAHRPGRPIIAMGLGVGVGIRPRYEDVVLLPDLLSIDQCQRFTASLTRAFGTHDGGSAELDLKAIKSISIILQGLPSKSTFSSFLGCVEKLFPGASELEFHLQICNDALGDGRINPIPLLSLQKVQFFRYDSNDPKALYQALTWPQSKERLASYAREWAQCCPHLKGIYFGGGRVADKESNWDIEFVE